MRADVAWAENEEEGVQSHPREEEAAQGLLLHVGV